MKLIKQYILYLFRWQLSSPILAGALILMVNQNQWIATITANLLGGLIFFWIDKYIFKSNALFPLWEIQEDIKCVDCGQIARGYRLVKTKNYDKSKSVVEFRCEKCSKMKSKELRSRGIII